MSRPDIIQLYTYKDYKLWKGDWELIAGHPVAMSPSPKPIHQRIARKMVVLFDSQLSKNNECNCEVFYELDWVVSDTSVVRPDIMILCGYNEEEIINETPKLVVEVISSSTREKDLNTKFNLYERKGVIHYIIVDPIGKSIEVYKLSEKGYYLVGSENNKYDFKLDDSCKLVADFSTIFS